MSPVELLFTCTTILFGLLCGGLGYFLVDLAGQAREHSRDIGAIQIDLAVMRSTVTALGQAVADMARAGVQLTAPGEHNVTPSLVRRRPHG